MMTKRFIFSLLALALLFEASTSKASNTAEQLQPDIPGKLQEKHYTAVSSETRLQAGESTDYASLLVGKWQSMQDPKDAVEFTASDQLNFYDGKLVSKESYRVATSCSDHPLNGGKPAAGESRYISSSDNMCWYIVQLDEDLLTLSVVGRGNELKYKRSLKMAALPMTDNATEDTDHPFITQKGVSGFSIGDPVDLQSENLKISTMETGEGSFPGYALFNNEGDEIGFILPSPRNEKLIGSIQVDAPGYTTGKGIGVGSSYQELKEKYPGLEIHGSEIEGETGAVFGRIYFQLNVNFWSYNIDESEIDPSTKITQVRVF